MRTIKGLLVLAAMLCMTAGAGAQTADTAKTSEMLKQLPAGAMGFVMVNSIEATTTSIDAFLAEAGISPLLGDAIKGGVLGAVKGGMQLGEGFDPKGGFAIVMLDPTPYGLDLAEVVKSAMGNKAPKVEVKDVPFVVFAPGKDFVSILPAAKDFKSEASGKFTKFTGPQGISLFVISNGGYVLISPVEKALTAVLAAEKKADSEISKDQLALLSRADLAMHLNMKVCGPISIKVMKAIEDNMSDTPMPKDAVEQIKSSMATYGKIVGQLDGVSLSARLVKTGVLMEEMVDYIPSSDLGKAIAAIKPSDKPLLGNLPNVKYVLACGASGALDTAMQADKAMTQAQIDSMVNAMVTASEGKITKEQGAKINKLMQDWSGQCTGVQLVAGGATGGQGLFGVASVVQCKDADKFKALLQETAGQIQDIIKGAVGDDAKDLAINYNKAVETIEGVSVDSLEVQHPELAKLGEAERAKLNKVLGEDKIRLFIANVDKTTIVVTFGGSKAFMSEAIKAAKSGGTLPKDKGIVQGMEFMPKNLVMVGAFNAANLFELIMGGMTAMGGGDDAPPLKISSQVPVMFGAGVTGTTEHVVVYVPSALIKDLIGVGRMFMGNIFGGGMGVEVPIDRQQSKPQQLDTY